MPISLESINVVPANNVYAILHDKVLGCGYGNHFNEDNLIYDKIIYSFDADVDGEHMAGLTLSSQYAIAPDLILTNRLLPDMIKFGLLASPVIKFIHINAIVCFPDNLCQEVNLFHDRFTEVYCNEKLIV